MSFKVSSHPNHYYDSTTMPAVNSMFFHPLPSYYLHFIPIYCSPVLLLSSCMQEGLCFQTRRAAVECKQKHQLFSHLEGWVNSPSVPGHYVLPQTSFQLLHHISESSCPIQACTCSQKDTLSPAKCSPFPPHPPPPQPMGSLSSPVSHYPPSNFSVSVNNHFGPRR